VEDTASRASAEVFSPASVVLSMMLRTT